MVNFPLPLGIKRVVKDNNIGSTPAKVFRDTGTVLVNDSFLGFPEDFQCFILCHEAGHIILDTDNEFLADDMGFKLYSKTGRSLKNAVKAISQTLPFDSNKINPELQIQWLARLKEQLKRAIEFDNKKNNLESNFMGLFNKVKPKRGGVLDTLKNAGIATINNQVAYRAEKQDKKLERRDAKNYIRIARGDAKNVRAQAELELAQHGVAKGNVASAIAEGLGRASQEVVKYIPGTQIGAGGGLADAASAIASGLGNNSGGAAPKEGEEGFWPKYKMYIIIGGVLVVVIVSYFVFFKKK
jgi:hypothetical protein